MIVLICGGRDMNRREVVNHLDANLWPELQGIAVNCHIDRVIHGGARGADQGAGDWAKSEGVPVTVYQADWNAHGRAAGPIRNRRMLEEGKPDVVVALPGGRGTADMKNQARAAGVPVIEL